MEIEVRICRNRMQNIGIHFSQILVSKRVHAKCFGQDHFYVFDHEISQKSCIIFNIYTIFVQSNRKENLSGTDTSRLDTSCIHCI